MKISFLDFWDGFSSDTNIFLDAIRFMYEGAIVVPPSNADIIFTSIFGNTHENYRGKIPIIQYIGEARIPNYKEGVSHLSFSFDNHSQRNYRLPLWLLQFNWFNRSDAYPSPDYLIPISMLYRNRTVSKRNKLSVSVFNHDPANNRVMYLQALQTKGVEVYAFGKPFGNWFYGERQKMQVISNFQFHHCFENSDMPGYHTEKIVHAYFAGCIPVYWGSNTHSIDFNPSSYIFFDDHYPIAHLVDKMMDIWQSERKLREVLEAPLFTKPPQLHDMLIPIKRAIDSLYS